MDKDLQYRAMEKLLNSLVKPGYEKIIDEIKVVPSTKMSMDKPDNYGYFRPGHKISDDAPTVKVYLTPNLLHYVSVENSSGVSFEDIQDLTDSIDWKITESLKHLGSPRYWLEFIQIQPLGTERKVSKK